MGVVKLHDGLPACDFCVHYRFNGDTESSVSFGRWLGLERAMSEVLHDIDYAVLIEEASDQPSTEG